MHIDAWLQGHVQRGALQPIVAQPLRARAQRDDLRVRRGVVARDRPVPSLADHLLPQHQDGAHRHFVVPRRMPRQFERAPHEINIPGLFI